MDQERFDDLTRRLGGSDSRRRLLLGAAALAAAGMGLGFELEQGEALGKFCRIPGSPCGNKRQCCARRCQNRICGCKPRGATCFQVGISCCSRRCHLGKCA